MTRTTPLKWFGAAAATLSLFAVSACGTEAASTSEGGGTTEANLVGYSVLEQANKGIFTDFAKTDDGKDVKWTTSYGASGDQSRAVESGLKADVVHFSLEGDVTRLVDAGLVDKSWNTTPTKGIATSSVVVFVVRKGNPKNIEGWDDIVKPGVGVVTPNPGSSGSARWNILAAWAHATADGGDEAAGKAFLTKFFDNAVALPGSGREATTAFTSGTGDVLLSYENEAILARQNGEEFDYVIPDDTLLIENPAAVTTDAGPEAKAFLEFLTSKEAQTDYAKTGFRPVVDIDPVEVDGANDPSSPFPEVKTLYTIADTFGGWPDAASKFFDEEKGIVTKIQAETGKQ